VTELLSPLENFLNEMKTSDETKRQLVTEMYSAVEVGKAETKEVGKTLDEVCAQNQVIAINGNRKRHRSSQEHQFLSTATATNDETMYNNGNGNDAGTIERGKKALKTNEHDCSSQQVRSSRTRKKRPTASRERTEIETAINNSSKKIPAKHDPSEEQEQSSSGSSNQSVTARNDNNPSHHVNFVAQQNAPSWNFESSGMSHTKNPEITELLKKTSPLFQKRIEQLIAFKAKFGHCHVSTSKSAASNKPYLSLGHWCIDIRYHRKLMEEGKPTKLKLCKAQIEILDALGFPWKFKSVFDGRIEELRAFKAKFGHCNVNASRSASNKPYLSLGYWCNNVRRSRRKREEGKPANHHKMSRAQIERLDALGFPWKFNTTFDERIEKKLTTRRKADLKTFDECIEELRAFKAKFGHCNVTRSRSASNKPYLVLGQWCYSIRRSRRLIEEGKPAHHKMSKAQIERLDALGFQWKLNTTFDERIEELRAFKAKFGHCNATESKSPSNKPYVSLGHWCTSIRYNRRLIEKGKPSHHKMSKAQIERLDALGFQWKSKIAFNERIE
jgi:hypothetical protein